jgi:transcriptional regulator with XRE-family HTH domain
MEDLMEITLVDKKTPPAPAPPEEESLGQSIVRLRKKKGLNQAALALDLGYTPFALTRWENDRVQPRLAALKALDAYFGSDLAKRFGKSGPADPPQAEESTPPEENPPTAAATEAVEPEARAVTEDERPAADVYPENGLLLQPLPFSRRIDQLVDSNAALSKALLRLLERQSDGKS